MAVSGRTTTFAPFAAASLTSAVSFFVFPATSPRSDGHCTAATFTVFGLAGGSATASGVNIRSANTVRMEQPRRAAGLTPAVLLKTEDGRGQPGRSPSSRAAGNATV